MTKCGLVGASVALLALWVALSPAAARAADSDSDTNQKDVFKNLEFRNLGPAVGGGRVTATVGIPGDPEVYYVGTGGGGVFKTTDGGISWKAIFERESTASIGAVTVAPSDPNQVWVGTGEANIRNDLIDGRGVYLSTDAGHSWKLMGLADAGQIADILVDPLDPNVVFVGVFGHAWGPNVDRGVFRTTDGGKTWKKVFYVDDSTGVADLVMQPGNPKVLYAAMWQARRYPWTMVDGGPNSGLYRSTDGGDTWKKLTDSMPDGPLGRIAVAVAPSNPNHLYALIAAKKGMLWQSTDMGDHWSEVNNSHALDVRPFYFSRLFVSPADENKIYFLSFGLMQSTDGGKTFHGVSRGVHPDHHALWIDPKNPDRMMEGNDGGAYLSTDGAKNWRFLDNLPIEQFYQVAVDSRTPYTVCGGLQDNNAWCGLSSDPGGPRVTGANWYTVQGGDGEYAVPAPSDPDVIYTDSQNGNIDRLDKKTHVSRYIRPYLDSVQDVKTADLKYRFNWTAPIAVSETDANEVYLGGNVVFKSTDAGKHWTPISDDLTRNDKSKQEVAGGPVQHDISGAETYDTTLSLVLAPTDSRVIWVGTDDGLVQVTRNGGKTWANVTDRVPGAPTWAMVYQIGVSPFDAGTAYAAFDAHKLDDHHCYVYKTADYGQTWQKTTRGLPDDVPCRVVREDPNQRGLLVLGTDTGLFFSQDAGGHWRPLKSNFPTVPVYDLTFVKAGRDLVVATHGRGIFIFDDIRPLEEIKPEVEASDFHLFSPAPGTQIHRWAGERRGSSGSGFSAPNAPNGAVIDYYLKSEIKETPEQKKLHESPVRIVVTDSQGNLVAKRFGPSKAGINRFVWNMRYDAPNRLKSEAPNPEEETAAEEGPFSRVGPLVLAGDYRVAATVNGKTQEATVTVKPDPTVKIDLPEFHAQLKAALSVRNQVNALNEMIDRIDEMEKMLAGFRANVNASDDDRLKNKYRSLLQEAEALDKKLKNLKSSVYNTEAQHGALQDSIHYLAKFQDKLSRLAGRLGSAFGEAPNELVRTKMDELGKELDQRLDQFNALLKSDVAGYNKAAYESGAPTLYAGEPIRVKAPAGI